MKQKFFEPYYMLHYEVDGKSITGTVYMVDRTENGTVLYLNKKTYEFDIEMSGEGEGCIHSFEFHFSFGVQLLGAPDGELFFNSEDSYMGNEFKRLAKLWEDIELYLLSTYIKDLT